MRGRVSTWCTGLVQVSALVSALAVMVGTDAHAKTWAKWAPSPLASDSAYAAMSARPADSLSAGQFAWLGVQRHWRAEREEERLYADWRTTDGGRLHQTQSTDARFAALAAQPYASLNAGEVAWLVADDGERQTERRDSPSDPVGGVLLALVAGLVGGWLYLRSAFD